MRHKFVSAKNQLLVVSCSFKHVIIAIIEVLLLQLVPFPLKIDHPRPYICSSFVCNAQCCCQHPSGLITISAFHT